MTAEAKRPSVARQVGATSIAQVASVLLSVLTLAVLARMLGPEVFGVFAITIAILALGTVLADAGFAAVLVQRPAIDAAAIGAATALSFALGILSTGGAAVLAGPLESALQFPGLAPILIATSLTLPMAAVGSVGSALLQRGGEFGRLSVITLLAQAANSVVSIGAAWRGNGVWSLVAGYWAAAIVSGVAGGVVIVRERPGITPSALSFAIRSGHVFTLAKVIGWAASNVDQIVLARLLGTSELGVYSRVQAQVAKVNLIFGAAAHRVFFSSFARMQENLQQLASSFQDALSGYLIVAGLLSAFTFIFAGEIVLLLLGPDWPAAAPVLQIAAWGMIARSGHVVTEAVPAALGLYRINAVRHALRLVLTLAGAVIGARWGLVGAMAGSVLAFWLFYLSSLAAVVRVVKIRPADIARSHASAIAVPVAPTLAAAGTALVVDTNVPWLEPFVCMCAFILAATAVLSWGPSQLIGRTMYSVRGSMARAPRKSGSLSPEQVRK